MHRFNFCTTPPSSLSLSTLSRQVWPYTWGQSVAASILLGHPLLATVVILMNVNGLKEQLFSFRTFLFLIWFVDPLVLPLRNETSKEYLASLFESRDVVHPGEKEGRRDAWHIDCSTKLPEPCRACIKKKKEVRGVEITRSQGRRARMIKVAYHDPSALDRSRTTGRSINERTLAVAFHRAFRHLGHSSRCSWAGPAESGSGSIPRQAWSLQSQSRIRRGSLG